MRILPNYYCPRPRFGDTEITLPQKKVRGFHDREERDVNQPIYCGYPQEALDIADNYTPLGYTVRVNYCANPVYDHNDEYEVLISDLAETSDIEDYQPYATFHPQPQDA